MDLITVISNDIKTAMREGDKLKRSTLRMISAKVHDEEIKLKRSPDEGDVLRIIQREIKECTETMDGFLKVGNAARVEELTAKLSLLRTYLPQQLDAEQVRTIVSGLITDLNITSKNEKGLLMKAAMPRLNGVAEGKLVNQIVTEELGKL